MTKRPVFGTPDEEEASTSFCERTNLSIRTCLRRFVRRGTGHSKSLPHHEAMVAIFVAWFNFCRIHETLRCTPAMQAGIASHVWSVEELVELALSVAPCDPPEPKPLAPAPEAPNATKATERKTSTGFTLKAVDGGKAAPRREAKPLRPGEQATIWTILREAKRREEQGPPDEGPKGAG